MFIAVGSMLSSLSRLEDKAFLERQQQLEIPSLEEDLEEFAETASFSRSKRNAMDEHRFYPVSGYVSPTIHPYVPRRNPQRIKIYF
jgi:hypothetical protein